MKIKTDTILEQLGQILPLARENAPASALQPQTSFADVLQDLVSKAAEGKPGLASLDKDQLSTMVEMMSLKMCYSAMNALGRLDQESGEDFAAPVSLFSSLSSSPGINSPAQPGGIAGTGIRHPSSSPARGSDFDSIIDKASETYRVDRDLIRSVIRAESGFDPDATSPKGAMGLMQLMPDTASGLGVKNAYNPEENIMAGTRYLKYLIDRYDGNVPIALAAYNWGMGNVERGTGRYPEETRGYVARIMRDFRRGNV